MNLSPAIADQIGSKFWFEPLDSLPDSTETTQWLVEGLFVEGGINYLTASAGHGKSLVVLDLVHAATHNRKFLGLWDVPQMNVLYCDQDSNNPREMNKRILDFGFEVGSGFYRMQQQGLRLDCREDVHWLAQGCADHDVKLVVFDALVRFHRLDEYSASDMAVIRDNLLFLTSQGISVIVLHHHSRRGSYRGSGELAAAADSMVSLQKVSGPVDRFILTVSKERTHSEGDPFESVNILASKFDGNLRLQGVKSNAPLDPAVQLRRRILEFCDGGNGKTKSEIRESVRGDAVKVDRAIQELLQDRPGLRQVRQGKKILYITVAELPDADEVEIKDEDEVDVEVSC
jgi:RecA-family ATPase